MKFWMLKVEDGGTPVTAHHNHVAARQRAEALARTTLSRVFILEAVEIAVPQLPPRETLKVVVEPVE